jgi:anti-anti-sigma factor
MLSHRPVLVMEMPERLSATESRTFMHELEPLLDAPRLRLVFDCSAVQHIDGAGVTMMLRCLEEAMKGDGDVKLAALSPQCQAIFQLAPQTAGFQTHLSTDEAVRSFNVGSAEGIGKSASSSVLFFRDPGALGKAS